MPYGCAKDVLLPVTKDSKSMVQFWKIFLETLSTHHQDIKMITSETPYKLAEIIRDTFPNLYRPAKVSYNNQKTLDNERILDSQRS